MKTKNIFKTLALTMLLMPTMLLTTACSSDDNFVNNNETTIKKGFEIPVTVTATRQGDEGTTRATYNGTTHKLGFSTGDQLYVMGSESSAGSFSGTLTWQSGGTFSGTITTDNVYSGTADELFTAAASNGYVQATLLPNGYGTYNFFGFSKGSLVWEYNNAFATSKATAIEQFSYEFANTYSSGFALAPQSAILNFTITGLAASTEVAVSLTDGVLSNVSGNVTTDGDGTATFAVGVYEYTDLNGLSLTVGGNAITLVSSSTSAAAGKIYNITRSKVTDLSSLTGNYTALNGETLTGTLTGNYKISIADGATVILNNVNITNLGNGCDWAGINCPGDATIILKGDNEVCAGRDGYDLNNYPGIWIAPGKTLNIMGDGSLTAYSDATDPSCAGIGGGYDIDCGNINISGGTINATGGDYAAGIGGGNTGACGTITISGGTITATGGTNSPGIGSGDHGSCAGITISGGTVTASSSTNQSTAIGRGVGGSCTSVTITTGITSLTMTNSYVYSYPTVNGKPSEFINATAVYANTTATDITEMLATIVTNEGVTTGMSTAGFATSYNEGTKTWTITKK